MFVVRGMCFVVCCVLLVVLRFLVCLLIDTGCFVFLIFCVCVMCDGCMLLLVACCFVVVVLCLLFCDCCVLCVGLLRFELKFGEW